MRTNFDANLAVGIERQVAAIGKPDGLDLAATRLDGLSDRWRDESDQRPARQRPANDRNDNGHSYHASRDDAGLVTHPDRGSGQIAGLGCSGTSKALGLVPNSLRFLVRARIAWPVGTPCPKDWIGSQVKATLSLFNPVRRLASRTW